MHVVLPQIFPSQNKVKFNTVHNHGLQALQAGLRYKPFRILIDGSLRRLSCSGCQTCEWRFGLYGVV